MRSAVAPTSATSLHDGQQQRQQNLGKQRTKALPDRWTAAWRGNRRSASWRAGPAVQVRGYARKQVHLLKCGAALPRTRWDGSSVHAPRNHRYPALPGSGYSAQMRSKFKSGLTTLLTDLAIGAGRWRGDERHDARPARRAGQGDRHRQARRRGRHRWRPSACRSAGARGGRAHNRHRGARHRVGGGCRV